MTAVNRLSTVRRLAFAALPSVVAAGAGGVAARNAQQVYAGLDKPGWAPSARVFGPVWSALYVLIGAAGWRISGGRSRRAATLHLTQMALNTAWPFVFFARGRQRAALGVVVALDAVLAVEIADLARTDPQAAALLAPYAAWSGFATALNASVS